MQSNTPPSTFASAHLSSTRPSTRQARSARASDAKRRRILAALPGQEYTLYSGSRSPERTTSGAASSVSSASHFAPVPAVSSSSASALQPHQELTAVDDTERALDSPDDGSLDPSIAEDWTEAAGERAQVSDRRLRLMSCVVQLRKSCCAL
jgi:hypothetical protein